MVGGVAGTEPFDVECADLNAGFSLAQILGKGIV